jgi:hypothetical protein
MFTNPDFIIYPNRHAQARRSGGDQSLPVDMQLFQKSLKSHPFDGWLSIAKTRIELPIFVFFVAKGRIELPTFGL